MKREKGHKGMYICKYDKTLGKQISTGVYDKRKERKEDISLTCMFMKFAALQEKTERNFPHLM